MINNRSIHLKYLLASLVAINLFGHCLVQVYASEAQNRLRDSLKPAPIAPPPPEQPRQPDPPQPQLPRAEPAPESLPPQSSPPQNNSKPKPNSGNRPTPPPPVPPKPTFKPIDFAYVQSGVLGQGDMTAGNRYFHVYYFDGKENQPVEIRLVGSNDSRLGLEPAMFLFGADGKEPLGRRFAERDSVRSSFMFMRLPKTGRYGIVVTSREPKKVGRYSLALRDDRTTYLLDQFGELSDRSPKLAQDNRSFEVVEFRGRRDQFVNIRVDSVRAEFLPLVFLVNSKGKVISTSRDDDTLYRVRIERSQLPEDDTYAIVVSSVRPNGRGKFRVSVY